MLGYGMRDYTESLLCQPRNQKLERSMIGSDAFYIFYIKPSKFLQVLKAVMLAFSSSHIDSNFNDDPAFTGIYFDIRN